MRVAGVREREPVACVACGKTFAPSRRSDAKFCSNGCVLADLVQRLEGSAHLLWWERVNAADLEHLLALDLARFRCLEGAAVLANLAEQLTRSVPEAA
jgi:hypothetical protein